MVRTAVLCALVAATTVGSMSATEVRRTSNCSPAAVAVSDFQNYEGSGQGTRAFTFLVSVTPAPGCAATGSVHVTASNGTATAPADYQPTTTTVSWNGDSTTRTVTVPVVADSTGESDESFQVALSDPVNLTISDATGTGRVLDDDDPPHVTGLDGGKICWSIDTTSGRGDVCPVVVRTGSPVRVPVTVRFRTIAVDGKPIGYEPVSDGLITIAPGDTTGVAHIRLRPGPRPPEERFVVELSDPSAGVLGLARAVFTIRS